MSAPAIAAPTKIGTVRIEHLRRLVTEGDTVTIRGERGVFDVRAVVKNAAGSVWLDTFGGIREGRSAGALAFRAIALDRVASVTTDGVATRKLQEQNR